MPQGGTLAWNTRDQLVGTPSGATISYDALGRMVARTTNGVTQIYLYDGLNAITAKGNLMPRGGGLDGLEAAITSAGTLSYLTDALGSPSMPTNASQTPATFYGYGTYGAPSVNSAPLDTPFKYTGAEFNGVVNLLYLRGRLALAPRFRRE